MSKIFIVRVRVDWHNTDPDDYTLAFINEEDAYVALEKEWKKFKNTMRKWDRDIIEESVKKESISAITGPEDYYSSWVEVIKVK